jgi:hypothetical protein
VAAQEEAEREAAEAIERARWEANVAALRQLRMALREVGPPLRVGGEGNPCQG